MGFAYITLFPNHNERICGFGFIYLIISGADLKCEYSVF